MYSTAYMYLPSFKLEKQVTLIELNEPHTEVLKISHFQNPVLKDRTTKWLLKPSRACMLRVSNRVLGLFTFWTELGEAEIATILLVC